MNEEKEIKIEKVKMDYEQKKCGRILLVGNGESQLFWKSQRKLVGNKWWKFLKNKSDLEIALTKD